MNTQTIILLLLTVYGVSLTALLIRHLKKKDVSQNGSGEMATLRDEMLRELQRMGETSREDRKEVYSRLDRVQDQLSKGLVESNRSIQAQFKQASEADSRMQKTISDITKALTEVKSTNKQVLDFSAQLQNLQNILKNPKQRGVLGEYWLETLLSNVLPTTSYKMQYEVGQDEKTGQKLIADAAIFVRDQIIPIDAKFTLENYNRMMQEVDAGRRDKVEKEFKADVKKRIDETAKYIRPEHATLNFAFMFIPAEGVYYNLLNADVGSGINSNNLVEYAFSKHVMLVSPTSFYAYLQTVLLGLKELEIEKSTQEIIKRVGDLGRHFHAYKDVHERLGKNLSTVVNQYNQSNDELRKTSRDIIKITNGSMDDLIEVDGLDRPILE